MSDFLVRRRLGREVAILEKNTVKDFLSGNKQRERKISNAKNGGRTKRTIMASNGSRNDTFEESELENENDANYLHETYEKWDCDYQN